MSLVSKKKMRGFTLIEVMIVVAIIGILSAIAIPNFMRFQARSKQSEAKTNLKALYTAQKAYFGEKDRYLTNFRTIGFEPESGNRYTYGIADDCEPTETPSDDRAAALESGCLGQDASRFPSAPAATAADFGTIGVDGTCPECDFTATAQGNVDNDPATDAWAITSVSAAVPISGSCGIDTDAQNYSAGEPANGYNDVTCDE